MQAFRYCDSFVLLVVICLEDGKDYARHGKRCAIYCVYKSPFVLLIQITNIQPTTLITRAI